MTLNREMNVAQTTDAIPTQPSSTRRLGTPRMMHMSMKRNTERIAPQIVIGFDGMEKNINAMTRYPVVSVV